MELSPIILFRSSRDTREEQEIASKFFEVTDSRVGLENRLVIARYSALPFYHELEKDLIRQGSRMINSHLEHQYVACFDYYEDLKDLTAETWFRLSDVPKDSGPWIVKGRTNSRKFQWFDQMCAKDWNGLVDLYGRLSNDHLLGPQGLVVRKFLDLELVEEGLTNPMFNEWRFFFYEGKLLSYGYYWSCGEKMGEIDLAGLDFAQKVADIVKDRVPFVVIDIARHQDGSWVLIELNDGQMSGLSLNEPEALYSSLKAALK